MKIIKKHHAVLEPCKFKGMKMKEKTLALLAVSAVGMSANALDLNNYTEVPIGNGTTPSYFSDDYYANSFGEVYSIENNVKELMYTLEDAVIIDVSNGMSLGYSKGEEGSHFLCEVSECNQPTKRIQLDNSKVFDTGMPRYTYAGNNFVDSSNKTVLFSRNSESDRYFNLNVYDHDGILVSSKAVPAYVWSFNGNSTYWINSTSGPTDEIDFKFITSSPPSYSVNIVEWDNNGGIFNEYEVFTSDGININDIYSDGVASILIGDPEIDKRGKLVQKVVLGRIIATNKYDAFIWGKVEKIESGYRFTDDLNVSELPDLPVSYQNLMFQGVATLNPADDSDNIVRLGRYSLNFNSTPELALTENLIEGVTSDLGNVIYSVSSKGSYLMRNGTNMNYIALIYSEPSSCLP